MNKLSKFEVNTKRTNFKLFRTERVCRLQFVGKGEIASYDNFSFSHSVFKTCTADT